ncbi:ferritin [Vulcanibacillus modesticaldus]|uniref:Ferritin n=1 Tax=Vulcanibacillus modesticaldus TaxID=337097 RepID=A0A1D2YSU4_9BACI|nr:ferritin [Vulcanibacillus modesticaldus]OEF98077.1 ferritin [Vulcanibacillus modesticaldus]
MLSGKLLNALNDQMNFEFESASIYLAMSAYCASEDLDGFAHFFRVQVEEERFHAMKFFDFINDKGGRVIVKGYEDPENEFDSIIDVFEKALEHEKLVTKRIYALQDIATEEKEYSTISFLNWFIDEQVEEEATFESLVKKLKRIGNDSSALYMLNDELAKRVFTPPAE